MQQESQITITADIEQPNQQYQFDHDKQQLQPRKPINVKRIVLIVLLSIAGFTSLIAALCFGFIIGIATFCSFSISIAILYPFCGTLLNNIVNPRPPKRRVTKQHQNTPDVLLSQ